MLSSRIAPLEAPYAADVQATLDSLPANALFRTLARNSRVLSRFVAGNLMDQGSITLREREIVISRTCVRCGSEYEWAAHVNSFAKQAELTPDQLQAIAQGKEDNLIWNEGEGLLIELVDALHDTSDLGDDLWRKLKRQFRDEQLVELIVLTSLYHMVSLVTKALRLPLEPGMPRWSTAN
jgi:alkylhydroperoxidase family enzyme